MHDPIKRFSVVAGIYGLALAGLIFSAALTPALVGLFTATPYTLGTHGSSWMYWQGTSCGFVGLIHLLALRWSSERATRDLALAGGLLYAVWGCQNLYRITMTAGFDPPMWLHVIGCLGLGVWGLWLGAGPPRPG